MSDNGFLFGLVLSQAVVIVVLTAGLLHLSASYSNFRMLVMKALDEMARADDELARRVNQIVSAFTLMDAFGAFKAPASPNPTPTTKKPPQHPIFKDKAHLSVVDPKSEDKKGDDKK